MMLSAGKSYFIKFTSMFLMGVGYFGAIRPLRSLYNEHVVYSVLFEGVAGLGNADSAELVPRAILLLYTRGEAELIFAYMPQFGFFFLLGMLGVFFFLPPARLILALPVMQLAIEFLVVIALAIGIHISVIGFVTADFLIVYLSPLVCLGFVVFLFARQKAADEI
jgi:hypothetical protein